MKKTWFLRTSGIQRREREKYGSERVGGECNGAGEGNT